MVLPFKGYAQQPVDGTLGFVVRDWFTAIYNSRFVDECPEGLAVSNDENWWRGLSKEKRAELTVNGLQPKLDRYPTAMRRGPNGENVCLNPTIVTDPPMRVVEGKYSYGVNLDGNSDGSATSKTCSHENFIHPDGTPGIDNQMYRLIGCVYGWRKGGLPELIAAERRGTSGLGMILIEITGVEDVRNDNDVNVTFYRSIDQFVLDGSGQPLPFSSYNVDMDGDKPRYGDSLKGAIRNGVLTTKRGDVSLPFYGNYTFMHPVIKDMDLRLEIATDGATANGLVSGYYNMDAFLHYIGGMVGHTSSAADCPAMYRAAPELADGYPDQETGRCTQSFHRFRSRCLCSVHHSSQRQHTTGRAVNKICLSFGAAFYLGCVTAALAQDAFVPANVQLATRAHGWILRNVFGMTLYTYMRDPIGGPSDCKDECAEIWRPLQVDGEADAKAEADGDWSINVRDDGTRQWAFRGKPLYTYSRDDAPGDMNGDEHQRQWYVALKPLPLPPGFNSHKTEFGHLLVDQKNMTLYTPSADVPAASVCDGDCAKTWPPVEAWWRARSTLGDWSVIDRADGTKQWAYKDQPLFRYVGDFQPGEITGDGVETFVVVVLEPPPSVPDWITIQNSDAGTLSADVDGKTLYAYDLPGNRAFGTPFDIGTSRDMATKRVCRSSDTATMPPPKRLSN